MAVGYKNYFHFHTDQPERHKYNQKNMFITRKNITYKVDLGDDKERDKDVLKEGV
jgi:hypothetical protein